MLPPSKATATSPEKGNTDSDFRHWFLKSAIFRVVYSLRYLVEKQRSYLNASLEEKELLA